MSIQRWKRAPGNITIDVMRDESGAWVCSASQTPVPQDLHEWLSANYPNAALDDPDAGPVLDIEFESSGYYDPGRMSGRPENCYPPEGDDERNIVRVSTDGPGPQLFLPDSLFASVYEAWGKYIDKAEVETTDDREPEDDDRDFNYFD